MAQYQTQTLSEHFFRVCNHSQTCGIQEAWHHGIITNPTLAALGSGSHTEGHSRTQTPASIP